MRHVFRRRLVPFLTAALLVIVFTMPVLLNAHPTPVVAAAAARHFASVGNLDCNGFSRIQKPLRHDICTDITGPNGGRGTDNGHYIGHDEPSAQFLSTAPGSGNNVQWQVTLPTEHALPATQSFENMIAFWFSMALCDPGSYPQNPCTPDSDNNVGGNASNSAGSAFLEMQFYPPGFSPFINQISCDTTHWCASLHINSLECNFNFQNCNQNCEEPTNFGFIQMNGVPTGPAGPDNATNATFTPNNETLLMNQGDTITATITDTSGGLKTSINDQTTGQSGFMVASAQNGFQSLNLKDCTGTNFTFHPEYATDADGNDIPWAALKANIGFSVETGHFETGSNGDGDGDDSPCFSGPTVAGCIGADKDFDGTSYKADWPDGTNNNATSIAISSPTGNGIGPESAASGSTTYNQGYSSLRWETDVPASESSCSSSNPSNCVVPPNGAAFYPFFAQSGSGASCTLTFGNDIQNQTTNDFGKDNQYDGSFTAWFFGTDSSKVVNNPCPPHAQNDFSISANPTSLTIPQGNSATSTISTAVTSGSGTVSLSASVSPSGPTVALNPTSVTAGNSSTLTVNVGSSVATGNYTVTVTGTEGNVSHSTTVGVTVTAPGANDFSLSASPTSVTIVQGNSGSSTISAMATRGNAGTVNLSASVSPSGPTVALNPTSVNTGNSSTLTISTSTSVAAGNYTVTITGTEGSATHSTTVSVSVVIDDFSISASPTSLTVMQNFIGTSTISTAVTSGEAGTINLTASVSPAGGPTAQFNNNSVTAGNSVTLVVHALGSTPPGTYTVTVTGTEGNKTHSTTVTVTVTPFSFGVNPMSFTMQGSDGFTGLDPARHSFGLR